jgi:2'-5' RNA ligase
MSKFGIILLLDRTVTNQAVHYSRALTDGYPAYMRLGDDVPPHITLMHAECDESAARDWWEAVRPLAPAFDVERAGVVFDQVPVGDEYVPGGGVTCGVHIVRSSALTEAHEIVLDAARRIGARPLGAIGESFRPHITLTVFRRFPDGPIPFDPAAVSGPAVGHLAFGELGDFGTFPRIIEVVSAGDRA